MIFHLFAALATSPAVAPPALPIAAQVERISITHVPRRIVTRSRLTLENLHSFVERTNLVLTRSQDVRGLAQAIATSDIARERTKLQPHNDTGYDARWSFVMHASDGKRTEVSCDAFGRRGAVDGIPVVFARLEPTLRRLEAKYPELEHAIR